MAALDSTEMTSDPEEQLEDDFVLKVELVELLTNYYLRFRRFQVPTH